MSVIKTGKSVLLKPSITVLSVPVLPIYGSTNVLYIIEGTGAIYTWHDNDYFLYDSRIYKTYTALLTQSGTDEPTAVELENPDELIIVWTYLEAGKYQATLTDIFDGYTADIRLGSIREEDDFSNYNIYDINIDGFKLQSSGGNDTINGLPISIHRYPNIIV